MTASELWTLADLRQRGAFAQRTGARGRPSAKSGQVGIGEVAKRPAFRIAVEVYEEAYRLGPRRGALAQAQRTVSTRRRIALASVIRHCKLYREYVIPLATLNVQSAEMVAEIGRRILGLPDDVQAKLKENVPAADLLAYLRRKRIDMSNDAELVDAVRATDFLSPK